MRLLVFLAVFLATSVQAEQLLDRPYRGISCLHCNASQKQAKRICAAMWSAKLKRNYINFLIDGTFGINIATMTWCIDALTQDGRELIVQYYLLSGPGQRRCEHYKRLGVPGFSSGMCSQEFNFRIRRDPKFQQAYQSYLTHSPKLMVDYAIAKGADVRLSWLEDNFTDSAFRSIFVLTQEVFAGYPIEYVRNSVRNTRRVPAGVIPEVHYYGAPNDLENGIVFNDGDEIKFKHQRPKDHETTLDDLAELRDVAEGRGNIYVLWLGQYQGNDGKVIINPLKRTYRLPRPSEVVEIVYFLRGNDNEN